MSLVNIPNRVGLALLLITLSVLSVALVTSMRPVSAAPTGTYFDHIVIIAMENTAYASVFGSGTVSSCPTSSAPFLCGMLPLGSTLPSYNSYGATAADTNDFNGCSAACYVGFMLGYTYGVVDGYSFSSLSGNPQFVTSLSSAGLTWQAYCESGCPRGDDHFAFSGTNTFTDSSVSTDSFITAANSATPPNFLWFTPTDSHNMHDVSVSTGDNYLQSFLVGSGSIASPASGSLLASNVFTNPNYHTLLYLCWDECGGINGSCDANNAAPNLLYGTPVKKGYVSPDTTGIDEYAAVRTIENNWGLSPLAQGDTAAASAGYMFNDVFASGGPLPLSTSFTLSPSNPAIGVSVAFTATSVGGTQPYSYSWNFGDGSTGSGAVATHSYSSAGQYSTTTTVTDSTGKTATSSQSVTVSQPGALTASFAYAPSAPVSGQSVTFTATATGGSSPYSYSWSLAGTGKTGNPVSQSFTNGTYAVSLTVTDGAGKTATSSQSIIVLPASTGSGSVPTLVGWGAVRMDESQAGSGGVSSAVFPGESASDMELLLIQLKAKGYNTVRVDFDPYCSDTVDYNYMSVYSQTNAQRAVQIAQHYGFWIIIDYHGYSDIFGNTSCWLSYWKPIIQNIGPLYSQIIWEPENEPTTSCNNSPSSCPSAPCSSDSSCVTYLSSAYQQWINQARSLGDTHWIVVQNLCSYSCNLCPAGDGACPSAVDGYPRVSDPLGTLSQSGRIFISLHSYMDFNSYYDSVGWNNTIAESVALAYYQTVVAGISKTGWPALNSEGGTDPLCDHCSSTPPDTILGGSAGYTNVTLHFIQTLTKLYDSNSPQRINWVWWPAGSWTDTTSSVYGAMNCASNPEGWGCLLQFVNLSQPGPDFTISASSQSDLNTGQSASSTITIAGQNGVAGTVTIADTVPSGLSCTGITPVSVTGSGTATISCRPTAASTYPVTLTGTSGSLVHISTFFITAVDFSLSANPTSISLNINDTGVSTITVEALNGFGGNVTIDSNSSSGLLTTLSSNSVIGPGNFSLGVSYEAAGTYTVVITGTSGSLTRTSTVTVQVGKHVPPVLAAPSAETVSQLGTISFMVNATDESIPSPTLTLSATRLPQGASFATIQGPVPVSGIFSWTPSTTTAPGTYTITFTVTDGVSSTEANLVITVIATNVLPVIIAPCPQNATVGATLHFTISAGDPTGLGGTVILSAIGLTSNMSFDAATGSFSFTPSASQSGQTFPVDFTATDSSDPSWTSTQTVPIHVDKTGNTQGGTPGSTPGTPPSTKHSPGVSGSGCVTCNLENGILAVAWFLLVGVIIGVVCTVAFLTIKMRARFSRHHNEFEISSAHETHRRADEPTQRQIDGKKPDKQRTKGDNEQN